MSCECDHPSDSCPKCAAGDGGLAHQLEEAIDATRTADHDTRIGRLSAGKVAKTATLALRSAAASRVELEVDIQAAEDVVDQRSARTLAPRSEDDPYQRGHDAGYSAGVEDSRRIAEARAVKTAGGRPEPRTSAGGVWMGNGWGEVDEAATKQSARQVAVTVSIIVALPECDDPSDADYVRAAVAAIRATIPQAELLIDNDTKQTGLNPMVDGGNILMFDGFCSPLNDALLRQTDRVLDLNGGGK